MSTPVPAKFKIVQECGSLTARAKIDFRNILTAQKPVYVNDSLEGFHRRRM
jgi:hypothetical protein